MKVSVIGLGYIGLPTSLLLARAGHDVTGVDIDENKIDSLRDGNVYIQEKGIPSLFEEVKNNISFSDTPEESDIFIVAVPTPIKDKSPDLSYIESAIGSIKPVLNNGNVIIIESTIPPKTTERFESLLKSEGYNVNLAYCPERAFPGNLLEELIHNDRLIGADEETAERIKNLYSSFTDCDYRTTDPTTAEIVKSAENTYRDINIAFANELSDLSEKVGSNVWDVIEMANMHPRVNIHKPGPGVGGHCIPIDPWFLNDLNRSNMIENARKVNDSRPAKIFDMILDTTKDIENPKICILGKSYKGNVSDSRESPSLKIKEILEKNKIKYSIHDPFDSNIDLDSALEDSDCIVLVTDHDHYNNISPDRISEKVNTKNIIDTRNILDKNRWEKAGFKFTLMGEGKREETKIIRSDVHD